MMVDIYALPVITGLVKIALLCFLSVNPPSTLSNRELGLGTTCIYIYIYVSPVQLCESDPLLSNVGSSDIDGWLPLEH